MDLPRIGQNAFERMMQQFAFRLGNLESSVGNIQAGNTVITTNGSGIGTISFPAPYLVAPVVVVCAYDIVYHVHQVNCLAASFNFTARNSAAALLVSTSIRVGWIAYPATIT